MCHWKARNKVIPPIICIILDGVRQTNNDEHSLFQKATWYYTKAFSASAMGQQALKMAMDPFHTDPASLPTRHCYLMWTDRKHIVYVYIFFHFSLYGRRSESAVIWGTALAFNISTIAQRTKYHSIHQNGLQLFHGNWRPTYHVCIHHQRWTSIPHHRS